MSPAMWKLLLRVGGVFVKEAVISKSPFTIGRDPKCDLWVSQPMLSRQHCRIENADDRFVLTDLGSTNGTAVNGQQVSTKVLVAGMSSASGTPKSRFSSTTRRKKPPEEHSGPRTRTTSRAS